MKTYGTSFTTQHQAEQLQKIGVCNACKASLKVHQLDGWWEVTCTRNPSHVGVEIKED